MSSARNPRTRKGWWASLRALGRGRFRDTDQGITYVDSRDMDDFYDAAEDEWEAIYAEQRRIQARAERDGLLPPAELRMKAAEDELETMWRVAEEQTGRRKGGLILP